MKVGEVVSMVLISLVFLLVGVNISIHHVWSRYCNWTVPWLCSAMALAVLVVALLSALTGKRVSELHLPSLWLVYAAVVIIGSIGIAVDGLNAWSLDELYLNLAEWLGFSIILLILLLAPRLQKKGNS